jgi:hypothetical protein
MLFRADAPLEPNTLVELSFQLPLTISGERGAQVMCRGAIARTAESLAGSEPLIAATIDLYQFVRVATAE